MLQSAILSILLGHFTFQFLAILIELMARKKNDVDNFFHLLSRHPYFFFFILEDPLFQLNCDTWRGKVNYVKLSRCEKRTSTIWFWQKIVTQIFRQTSRNYKNCVFEKTFTLRKPAKRNSNLCFVLTFTRWILQCSSP